MKVYFCLFVNQLLKEAEKRTIH